MKNLGWYGMAVAAVGMAAVFYGADATMSVPPIYQKTAHNARHPGSVAVWETLSVPTVVRKSRPPALLRSDGRWAEAETDVPDVMQLARAEWSGVLMGTVLGEGEQTIQVPITAARTIVDELGPGNYIYRTVCFLAEMPDLTGMTVTGAALKVYCEVFDPFEFLPQISNVPAHVGAPAEWDDETEDLSGISVQSGSPSEGITIDGVGWYSWDVLGDETVGVIKVLEDLGPNPGDITLTIRSHAAFTKSVGDLVVTSVVQPTSVATFSDTDDGEFAPYLELTVSGSGGDPGEPNPGTTGANAATVGVLMF